jgi:hypothetical protein
VIVGFTGTREGMSDSQKRQLAYILSVLKHADLHVCRDTLFIDGDCPDGADREARAMAVSAGYQTDPHPPKEWTAKELLARDRVIAGKCHVMIAAPRTDKEEIRSGTWATVRYTREAGKPVVMLSR